MSSSALVSLSRHTLRQVKFILPGGLITFSLGTHDIYLRLLKGEGDVGGWAQYAYFLSFCATSHAF